MTDKIAEIRARHEAGPRPILPIRAFATPDEIEFARADADRAFLLAEVDRQRAENARLRADVPVYSSEIQKLLAENNRHRRELEKLKIERDSARGWPKLFTRDLPAPPYRTAAGCMCPSGANLSCQNSFCPRRNPPGVTCQGGKP